jgi:hypothetical protein
MSCRTAFTFWATIDATSSMTRRRHRRKMISATTISQLAIWMTHHDAA